MSYVHPEFLISVDELAAQIDNPSLRLFDTSVLLHAVGQGYTSEPGRARYLEEHIPGAAFINLTQDWSDTTSGLNNTLPGVDALSRAIGKDGIGNDNLVVLYSSSHLMWATRAWWLLRYAGHTNVKVLNGNLTAWIEAGLPTRGNEERYPAAEFSLSNESLFVNKQEVARGMRDAVCTVNALSPELYEGTGDFYYGRRAYSRKPVGVFCQYFEWRVFLPAAELRKVLEAQGMLSAPRTLIYCGGGIAATLDGFACMLLGQTNIGVYDGSMSEWAADESLPLTLGSAP